MKVFALFSRLKIRTDLKLLEPVLVHWKTIVGTNLMGLLAAGAEGLSITLIVPLITHPTEQIRAVLIGGALVLLTREALLYLNSYGAARYQAEIASELRARIAQTCYSMNYLQFKELSPGSVIELYLEQSAAAVDVVNSVADICLGIGYLIVYLFAIVWIENTQWIYLAVGFLIAALAYAGSRVAGNRITEAVKLITESSQSATRTLLDDLTNMQLVRSYGLSTHRSSLHAQANLKLLASHLHLYRWKSAARPLVSLVVVPLLLVLVLLLLGQDPLWLTHHAPLAIALVYVLYRVQIQSDILSRAFLTLKERWFETKNVLTFCSQFEEASGQDNLNPAQMSLKDADHPVLKCENLSFRFNPDSRWILSKVNLAIPLHRVTAIIGKTGSGKSTLVNHLIGLYHPNEGKVLLQGRPLQEISAALLCKKVIVVSGDSFLFDQTILYNICCNLEAPEVTLEDVKHAASLAEIHTFIESLPGRYEAHVGYQGLALSSGQKQRICLARALLRKPEILILDEATNHLDLETENKVLQNIRSSVSTLIVVTHRSHISALANRILTMDNGRILDTTQGTESSVSI